jgi:SAM-dependent methyltransferase
MQSNWQENFFRGVALDAWRRIITVEMTRSEVDFLEGVIDVGPGAQLLDVPCGNGRHAIELATRGYKMTGLDLSEEFIIEARGATALRHSMGAGRYALANVGRSEFDGAFCFGNSFGYLNRDETQTFLAAVARALKPGARFVIDTGMAAESILPSLARTRWFRLGDILMLSENRYDAAESRLDIDYTFVHRGEVETRPTSSYVFTAGELCRMLADAGLRPIELLGSFNRDPYQIGSPRLILVSSAAK